MNVHHPITRPRPHRRYDPVPPSMWAARLLYLRQALAKAFDPSAPEPDIELLAGEPHGPFTSIIAGTDPETDRPAIFVTSQNTERQARRFPPEVFLVVDLLLAFGGGCSFNHNGKGLAYVRLFGGNDRIQLGRIFYDAQLGQQVRQDPRADHRDQHPLHFARTGGEQRGERPPGTPRRGREDAIKIALGIYDRNCFRAAIKTTREEYERVLREACRLVDLYFASEPS